MKTKLTLTVICSHVIKDRMMHAADLFERWKILVEQPIALSGELKEGESISSVISKTKAALEKTGEYRVVAIFHPFLEEGAWCDSNVIQISFGHQFCTFADYLVRYNYAGVLPARYTEQLQPA